MPSRKRAPRPFDPFEASREEAEAQPDAEHPLHGAIAQWETAQLLKRERDAYEKNPLYGMSRCVHARMLPPDWLAAAFQRGVYKVSGLRARTWDEAFGPARSKSFPFAARQRLPKERRHLRAAIFQALLEDPRRPIDAGFWEEVAERATGAGCPMGKTKAEEIYGRDRRSQSIQDVRDMLAVLSVASHMRAANRSRPIDDVFFAEVSERAGVPPEDCRYHLLTPDGECWDVDPDLDLDPAKFAPAFSPKRSGVPPKR